MTNIFVRTALIFFSRGKDAYFKLANCVTRLLLASDHPLSFLAFLI